MDEQQQEQAVAQQDNVATQEAQQNNDAVQQAEEQRIVQAHQKQQQLGDLNDKPKWMTYKGDEPMDYVANAALFPFNAVASEMTKGIARGLYLTGAGNMFGNVTIKDVQTLEEAVDVLGTS